MKTQQQQLGFGRLGRPFSAANYSPRDEVFEFPPSRTQPNMALTIQEIFSRFIHRQPLPDVVQSVFSDVDLSQYDNMSKIDKAQAARQYADRIAVLTADELLRKQKLAKQQDAEKRQSEIDFAVQQKLDDISSRQPKVG